MLDMASCMVREGKFVLVDSAFGQRKVREDFLGALRSVNPDVSLFVIYCHSDDVNNLRCRLLFRNSDPFRTEVAGFSLSEVLRLRKEYESPIDDTIGGERLLTIDFDSDSFRVVIRGGGANLDPTTPLCVLAQRIAATAIGIQKETELLQPAA